MICRGRRSEGDEKREEKDELWDWEDFVVLEKDCFVVDFGRAADLEGRRCSTVSIEFAIHRRADELLSNASNRPSVHRPNDVRRHCCETVDCSGRRSTSKANLSSSSSLWSMFVSLLCKHWEARWNHKRIPRRNEIYFWKRREVQSEEEEEEEEKIELESGQSILIIDFEETLGGETSSNDHCFPDETKDVSQGDQTRQLDVDRQRSHDLSQEGQISIERTNLVLTHSNGQRSELKRKSPERQHWTVQRETNFFQFENVHFDFVQIRRFQGQGQDRFRFADVQTFGLENHSIERFVEKSGFLIRRERIEQMWFDQTITFPVRTTTGSTSKRRTMKREEKIVSRTSSLITIGFRCPD